MAYSPTDTDSAYVFLSGGRLGGQELAASVVGVDPAAPQATLATSAGAYRLDAALLPELVYRHEAARGPVGPAVIAVPEAHEADAWQAEAERRAREGRR